MSLKSNIFEKRAEQIILDEYSWPLGNKPKGFRIIRGSSGKYTEREVAEEVMKFLRLEHEKTPEEKKTEQLGNIYNSLYKAMKTSQKTIDYYKETPIEELDRLRKENTNMWCAIDMALLTLGNYVDRNKVIKDV